MQGDREHSGLRFGKFRGQGLGQNKSVSPERVDGKAFDRA